MRYISLNAFRDLLEIPLEEKDIIEETLVANNIEYDISSLVSDKISDEDIDSLLELNSWKGNVHCAIFYDSIIFKSRTIGFTNPLGLAVQPPLVRIILVNGINMNQFIDLYKRTLNLRAFL